jgi:glycosyltransferase involved in cell wall biosynthesis
MQRLKAAGCGVVDLRPLRAVLPRTRLLAAFSFGRVALIVELVRLFLHLSLARRPHLVVVSQGGNCDGWPIIAVCRRLRLRYVVIAHKASDLAWPADWWRESIRRAYAEADWCFFVSEHTRRLTAEQIGQTVEHGSIVRNPFKVPWESSLPWPEMEGGHIRLGCVARLDVTEKGQDILLRVLALEKWRRRPVSLTMLGDGQQRQGLEAMAARLELSNICFAGHTDDIPGFWANHHALVLASRAEGLPLALVEALLAGRPAIVTDIGGNAEMLEDGKTGFVAEAPTVKALDEALERAWRRRDEWAEIGRAAAEHVRRLVPSDPAASFAGALMCLAARPGSGGRSPDATLGPCPDWHRGSSFH